MLEILEKLTCPICLNIFDDPVNIECETRKAVPVTSHRYNQDKCEAICCRECAKKLLRSRSQKCFHCRKPWDGGVTPNVFVSSLANDQPRKCNLYQRGCSFTGIKDEILKHEKVCGYVMEECPNVKMGCRALVMRRDLTKHRDECAHFPCVARFGGVGCCRKNTLADIKQHMDKCEYVQNKMLMNTVTSLHVQGRISKKSKGKCFLHCNFKEWDRKLQDYKSNKIEMDTPEDFQWKINALDE